MKRILAVLFIVMLTGGLCFAQEANKAAAAPAQPAVSMKAVETKTLIGTTESVTIADPAKGTKSGISVVDDTGKKVDFLVKDTTTIYDSQWLPTTLSQIVKSIKVKVRYSTTKESVNEAVSINVIK